MKERNLTATQLKIIGKLLNMVEECRLPYIEGMADYTIVKDLDDPFVIRLCDYLTEYGVKKHNIESFCKKWKEGSV